MNTGLKKHFEGPGGISQMVGIAMPMVASSACETAMTFTYRLFLSRLGPAYMSAAMGDVHLGRVSLAAGGIAMGADACAGDQPPCRRG